MSGDRAWATTDVQHWAEITYLLGKCGQGCPQPRLLAQVSDAERDVLVSDSVIGRTDSVEVGGRISRIGHGLGR
jgi:hypothetical protein